MTKGCSRQNVNPLYPIPRDTINQHCLHISSWREAFSDHVRWILLGMQLMLLAFRNDILILCLHPGLKHAIFVPHLWQETTHVYFCGTLRLETLPPGICQQLKFKWTAFSDRCILGTFMLTHISWGSKKIKTQDHLRWANTLKA